MNRIKHIDPFSFSKLIAFMGVLIGFILGTLYSFGGLILDTLVSLEWVQSDETPGLSKGTLMAFGALIGMPLIFSLSGLILGFIAAWLYNFSTRFFGGLDLDLF